MKGPNTSRWTVKKYLEEIYIPDRQLQVGLKDSTEKLYVSIAEMFIECVGHDVKLREVTDAMLDRFKEWSSANGCVPNTAQDRAWFIKAILRHWSPERHPKVTPVSNLMPHWQDVDCDGSLEQIFHKQYLPENPKITSEFTIKHYGRAIKMLGQCLGKIARIEDLTDHNIGKFLRWLVEEKKIKAVSANGYAKQIKAIWNWAAKKRIIENFPTIPKLPEPEVIPKAWTKEQLSDLLYACERTPGKIGGMPANDWLIAFHYVAWDTGERTGALLAIEWSMFDTKSGHLTVPARIRKGKKKAMVYRLKPQTVEKLKSIRKPKRDMIFSLAPYQIRVFYRIYKRLIKRAGLPYERFKSGPQKMRRTFASFIKAAGGDATRALRHSSTRVTDDSYLDPAIADPEPPNTLLFDLKDSSRAV